jgi:hypothetical protein
MRNSLRNQGKLAGFLRHDCNPIATVPRVKAPGGSLLKQRGAA